MRQKRRLDNGLEICGSIVNVRAVEDCLRATKKYTEGMFRRSSQHPTQGEDFPSKVVTHFYEVFPYVDISLDMPLSTAWAWIWGDEIHIDVLFHYDYRSGKASVEIGGVRVPPKFIQEKELKKRVKKIKDARTELENTIPIFKEALQAVSTNGIGGDA